MDKIKEIVHRLNDKAINPEKDTDLLLDELNRIGIFFVDTDSRTEWYFNEPTTKTETSEKANDLIPDVSVLLVKFGKWYQMDEMQRDKPEKWTSIVDRFLTYNR